MNRETANMAKSLKIEQGYKTYGTNNAKISRKGKTSPLPTKTHGAVDKRGNAGVGVAGTGKSAKKSPFYPRKKRA